MATNTALGGGVGAGVGAITGGLKDDMTAGEGALKGLGIGAGIGAGGSVGSVAGSLGGLALSKNSFMPALVGMLSGTMAGSAAGGIGGSKLVDHLESKTASADDIYTVAFMEKCAQYGIDPVALVKWAKGDEDSGDEKKQPKKKPVMYGPNYDSQGRNKWDRAGLPTPGKEDPKQRKRTAVDLTKAPGGSKGLKQPVASGLSMDSIGELLSKLLGAFRNSSGDPMGVPSGNNPWQGNI